MDWLENVLPDISVIIVDKMCKKKGKMMKVLNLLTSGRAGGIESLCRDIGVNSKFENAFCFVFSGG